MLDSRIGAHVILYSNDKLLSLFKLRGELEEEIILRLNTRDVSYEI